MINFNIKNHSEQALFVSNVTKRCGKRENKFHLFSSGPRAGVGPGDSRAGPGQGSIRCVPENRDQ